MKKTFNKLLIFLLIVVFGFSLMIYAESSQSVPFGDQQARRGGQLSLHTTEFPKSFNYFTTNTTDTALVFGLVYDTLLEMHPTTIEYEPLIAKSWEISDDKKTFTFKIDPRAKWADGKSVTTADVKFTYDTIMDPKNLTSVERMLYSRFNEPKIVDENTIQFTAKKVHFFNFNSLASLPILPKHLFEGKDFNKAFNMSLPPGSGPYILSEVKAGRYYTLTRRKNYWADKLPQHRGMYNFEKIKYKVMAEDVAFEAFKKGDFDIFNSITAKRWVTETNTPPFRKNWIIKQKVYNYAPRAFSGLALNMRRPIFRDLRIRQALCYLLDRQTLIDKIMYKEYQPLSSYWPSLYRKNESTNLLIKYDPTKAKELLMEAGYTRLDKDGYLVNQKGERMEFTISYVSPTWEKNLTLYVESCKDAGVKVNLELLSWATLMKRQDEYKFDAVLAGWQATLFDDPEQLWHSKHINEIGGSNLPAYKNAIVDQLIDSMPPIFDSNKRMQILKQIDRIIYREYPYVLFWSSNYFRVFYHNEFGMPKTVFTKYGQNDDLTDAILYWWYDPAKMKSYKEAIAHHKSLPKVTEKIYYDENVPK